VPDCPEALWRIVERLLAKGPEQRYQTARQIMNALAVLLPSEVPAGHRFEEVVQREIVRRTLRSRPPQEDEPAPSGPRLVKTERIGPDFVPVSPASPSAGIPVPSTGRIPSSSLLPPAEIALTRPLPPEIPVPPEVPMRPGRAFPVSPSRARSMGRWHEVPPVRRARGSTGRWHEEAPAPRTLRSAGRWDPPPPAPPPAGDRVRLWARAHRRFLGDLSVFLVGVTLLAVAAVVVVYPALARTLHGVAPPSAPAAPLPRGVR
jgi:hypothetical protein